MIIVYGEITIDPAAREELVAGFIALQEATQQEEGCLRYVFATDLKRDDLIHVSEHWASNDAVMAHLGAPHMAAFGKVAAGKVKGTVLKKYDASGDGNF